MVCENGRPVGGDALYVEYLDQAGRKASEKGSFIIVPAITPGEESPVGYVDILKRYPEVFYQANFQGLRHDGDGLVRRMSWFAYNDDYTPILSAHLLSVLLLGNDHINAIREAKGTLIGVNPAPLYMAPSLSRALRPENQMASSRLFYSLLPQQALQNKYENLPDIWRSVVWRPGQINGPNETEPDFKNKIVIIGANYEEYGDIHQTVFGVISGSYLLANATNMLLNDYHPRDARRFNAIFIVITGVLACFLYTRYPPIGPTIFFTAVAVVSQISSVSLFNRYGVFFDAWIPAFGMGLYNLGLVYKDRVFYLIQTVRNRVKGRTA
mgnify:CR=1 FL=1